MIMNNKSIGQIICESEGIASAKIQPKMINGKVVAECVLQTADQKNRNGRYYAEEELFPQLDAPRTRELLATGTLRAECGHPLSKDLQRQSTIDDTKTCARFLKLWTEGKDVMAHVVGTNSEYGRAFDLDLKEGCLPAWSLRALGSVEMTRRGAEVKNLRLITWDNVIYPSHPTAYTKGLVSESAGIVVPDTHLQTLVQENCLDEENDLKSTGIVIPIYNESVINFIKTESANLKFVRECFDFAYTGINVSKNGTKVYLSTNEGDTIIVNLENYIHNELLEYSRDINNNVDLPEEDKKFSILTM